MFTEMSFELNHRNEYLQIVLWNRVIESFAKGKVKDLKDVQKDIHLIIYPIEFMATLKLQQYMTKVHNKYRQVEMKLRQFTKSACILTDIKKRIQL
mmetsp:Transcript_11367/g.17165  ORF Transcript_11367/g.17165 Transcript_11367/m.17165 type:complete len:96 (-) Transcript_11367:845-1132(-)